MGQEADLPETGQVFEWLSLPPDLVAEGPPSWHPSTLGNVNPTGQPATGEPGCLSSP